MRSLLTVAGERCSGLALGLAVALLCATPAAAQGNLDLTDVIDTLTVHLDLTGNQPTEVKTLLGTFATDWDSTINEYQDSTAKNDKKEMIDDLKHIQDTYKNGLAGVLSSTQMQGYEALVDTVMHQVFDEVAELKLRNDMQVQLGLSEEQITQLKPVMGNALFEVVQLLWKDAGKRMGLRRKLQLANHAKKIENTAQTETNKILTPAQVQQWDAMKKAAKDASGKKKRL